ncbi:MAG: putative lipid II flippase FtsW [Deltaproteobacteria bacterium]|jgi:cell division protein FtsW|nr:putative lipid II flippase FtsW [Deltaproteobacteria bacterium]
MISKSKTPLDTVLASLVFILMALGLIMLLSASYSIGELSKGDPYYFIFRQLRHALLGVVAILVLWKVPYQFWLRFGNVIMLISVGLLVAVLIPGVGIKAGGATRWLPFLSIQPSELAKIAVVIFVAKSLSKKGELVNSFSHGFLPQFLVMLIFAGLILLEKDLGGALIIMTLVMGILFVAGLKHIYFFIIGAAAIPTVWGLISLFRYRLSRISGWYDPWIDPQNSGYPIIHSFFAFANGGLVGVGPGASVQKLSFLPEVHTDYIFSVVGEELGFIGVCGVALLFLIFCARGLKIGLMAKDLGGFYLAPGLTMVVILPAFLNMGVALSIWPSKGLPLPFFSYGGSSFVVSCLAVGLLLNIAGQGRMAENAANKSISQSRVNDHQPLAIAGAV